MSQQQNLPADPKYPNTRPDRTISLVTPSYRKKASLCFNRAVAANKLPIPWIVDDTIIGGVASFEDLIGDEPKNWGYRWRGTAHNSGATLDQYIEQSEKMDAAADEPGESGNHNSNAGGEHPPAMDAQQQQQQQEKEELKKRRQRTLCTLPFGHVRRILARTRISATITCAEPPRWVTAEGTPQSREQALNKYMQSLNELLKKYAPAWRIQIWRFAEHSQQRLGESEHRRRAASIGRGETGGDLGGGQIVLERRAKVFVFGITGGNAAIAQRARYAEMTWGARTPIQWFSDQWDDQIRPCVDLHPLYLKDRFNHLTFKISRIWQVVHERFVGSNERIDWYIRLWDDNYFYEENLFWILYRIPNVNPQTTPVLAGKLGIRHLGPEDAVFPFAGGGAGWYLTRAAMQKFGPSIGQMEAWIPKLRARKDIFLPHGMHDEDVFLTAWIGKFLNISCLNIPGVEHVSPGMGGKQRCMTNEALRKLRWDPKYTIFFDYTGRKQRYLRVEDTWYSYTKPLIWHYMSPRRLLRLEGLLYEDRAAAALNFADLPSPDDAPATVVDAVKKKKACYPGVPDGEPPARDISIFEQRVPPSMLDKVDGGLGRNGNADPELPTQATTSPNEDADKA